MTDLHKSHLPTRIVWNDTKERPKTEWLLRGFNELGIPITKTKRMIAKYKPRSNRLGLYVYPIEFHFGEKKIIVMYDINTIPNMYFRELISRTDYYFKIHIAHGDLRRFRNLYLFPNSASRMEYLDILDDVRRLKDRKEYTHDFLFVGWNDDDGLRLWTVKEARRQPWRQITGCLPFKHHTTVPKVLQFPRIEYKSHLMLQVQTKLNLALPGGGSLPFMSFRHVELLGMGCAVITRAPTSTVLGNMRDCMIYYNKNHFVDMVNYYLHSDREREEIAARARKYYEDYLSPKAHAIRMISVIRVKENLP